jgi:hypothetical protein
MTSNVFENYYAGYNEAVLWMTTVSPRTVQRFAKRLSNLNYRVPFGRVGYNSKLEQRLKSYGYDEDPRYAYAWHTVNTKYPYWGGFVAAVNARAVSFSDFISEYDPKYPEPEPRPGGFDALMRSLPGS